MVIFRCIGSFHYIWTHPVYSRQNTTSWYMLRHKANNNYKNDTGGYFLRYHFSPRVIKYHHSERINHLLVVFKKCAMLIFCKYDMKLPSPVSYVDSWNFTMKIFYHIESSMERFDMFRKMHNAKKWYMYVTGCKHFQDPMLEIHINSFAQTKRWGLSRNRCLGHWSEGVYFISKWLVKLNPTITALNFMNNMRKLY